jgi:hypothetical protein
LVENANVWGLPNIMNSCEGPIKVAHCKKINLSFGMHPQLINMDLQEGMVIKDI